jgi:hypothetical protein
MLKGVAAMMQLREVLARRRQEDLFVLASTVGHTGASLASRNRSCCWAAKAASRYDPRVWHAASFSSFAIGAVDEF